MVTDIMKHPVCYLYFTSMKSFKVDNITLGNHNKRDAPNDMFTDFFLQCFQDNMLSLFKEVFFTRQVSKYHSKPNNVSDDDSHTYVT